MIPLLKSTGRQIVRGRRCIIHCTGGRRSRRTSSSLPSLTGEEESTIERLAADILSRNNCSVIDNDDISSRISLSKAITLVESKSPRKRLMADTLLERLKQSASDLNSVSSFRLGVAGPPGVGKSTFVEAFGMYVLGMKEKEQAITASFRPEKVAVLCIDPSSHVTGGSVLGDKTRMSSLSHHPRAFVRPSPSSGHLGGLGSYTYDAASLCELAGYQLTIIETVGVGQSEIELAECCDLLLLMLAPGGGDELQGTKKGIVEVADMLVVNKADGEAQTMARKTANEYKSAMRLLRRKPSGWWGGSDQCGNQGTPVLLVSAKTGYGLEELWHTIIKYQQYVTSSGFLLEKRRRQKLYHLKKKYMNDSNDNDDYASCDFVDSGLRIPSGGPIETRNREVIATTTPATSLEIALRYELDCCIRHNESLTNEIIKLRRLLSKWEQTYKRKKTGVKTHDGADLGRRVDEDEHK
ncbi:hypothetical protein ACHAW5_003945 [Stephanodiscus triporus]|uniref:Uncharacterized protein n=1 Tax=Stephanodiscus triporus TaxID=2934178 RepID=A0ABD3P491_9STRA